MQKVYYILNDRGANFRPVPTGSFFCNSLNRLSPDLNHTACFWNFSYWICEAISLLPITRRSLSQMTTCHFKQQILCIFMWTPCQTPFPDASVSNLFNNQFLYRTWEVIALPYRPYSFWNKDVVSPILHKLHGLHTYCQENGTTISAKGGRFCLRQQGS